MRPGESDELLSAYLDREVTPAEREVVESQLDASPDTRAELDALAELSLCLRTFDRPEAPSELKSNIMQGVATRRIAVVPVKPSMRRLRREWNVMTIAAIATAACGLYFAVSGWDSGNETKTTPFAVGMSDSAHPTVPASLSDMVLERDRVMFRNESGDGLARTPATSWTSSLETRRDLQPRSAAVSAPMSSPDAAAGSAPMRSNADFDGTAPVAGESSGSENSGLDKVALNDFLKTWAATDAPDRYVANIDLQVLDVRRTADGFQALLFDNGVMKGSEEEAPLAKKSGSGKKVAGDATDPKQGLNEHLESESMIAVYVDTTADRVVKSLEELSQKYEVVGIRLQQPLALAREVEDEVITDSTKKPKMAEKSQRRITTTDDVTNEYVLQQQANYLAFSETDEPADALAAIDAVNFGTTPQSGSHPAAESSTADSKLASTNPATRAAKMLANQKVDAATDTKDRNSLISLNYCSEVRLPLMNRFESAPYGDMNMNTNGIAPMEAKANRLSIQNTTGANNFAGSSLQANQPAINSGNAYSRYRQSSGRDGASTVRVLVVFQDAPIPARAKAER